MRRAQLVMREHQVRPARLDVEHRAEVLGRDRRALDVPARPPGAELRVPGRLPRPGAEPDQRVQRILLPRPARVTAALRGQLDHGRRSEPGHRAEGRVGRPGKVHVAVQVIERAMASQGLVEPLDDAQRLNRPDQAGRGQDPQRRHVPAVPVDLAPGQVLPVFAVPGRPFQQRVIDIGDVLHVADLVTGITPGADQQVPGDVGRRVPDMRGVIGSYPACVQGRGTPGRGHGELAAGRIGNPHLRAAPGQVGNACGAPGFHERQATESSARRRRRPVRPARRHRPGRAAAARSRAGP